MKRETIREILNKHLSKKLIGNLSKKSSSTTSIFLEDHIENSTIQSERYGEFILIEPDLSDIEDKDIIVEKTLRTLQHENYINNIFKESLLFFDLETAGFWNTYIFLFGCLTIKKGQLKLFQGLARDYSQEHALLSYLRDKILDTDLLVSFNGKSFDLPVFNKRCQRFKLKPIEKTNHLDILHLARRKLKKDVLPNRKLTTLEKHLLGKYRTGDIPSHLIPKVYHNFVRTEDARDILRVIRHNAYDISSLLELIPVLYKMKDPSS